MKSVDEKIDALALLVDGKIDALAHVVDEKIDALAEAMAIGFTEVRGDMVQLRLDMHDDMKDMFELFFNRHIEPIRNDHDALAGRVKRLEERVFV